MYCLFATAFNQFFNRPNAAFDACGLRWRHADGAIDFAEVVIREIQGNRSLKVFKLSAECVRQTGESAAMHTQRVILLFNMARGDSAQIGHTADNCALRFHDFCRAIPTCCVFVEVDHRVGFYELPVIHFAAKSALNGFRIGFKGIAGKLDAPGKTPRQIFDECASMIPVQGQPDIDLISTTHVEKQNHTLRMHCRRLSRLTNAFSKKLENFKAAIALHDAYYNFVKAHKTIRCAPAVEAGVESSAWTVQNLVEMAEA